MCSVLAASTSSHEVGVVDKSEFVSVNESGQRVGHSVGQILMHGVSRFGQHQHLELALHLSHCQLLVKSVHSGQYQQFWPREREVVSGQSREPPTPILLRFEQIRSPEVGLVFRGRIRIT